MDGANKNISAIDALIAKKHEVTVRGELITLSAPSAAAVKELYSIVAKYSTVDEDNPIDGMEMGTEMSVGALIACIDGLDRATAERLLPISGGAFSELAMLARSLCGLDQEQLDERRDKKATSEIDRPF